MTEDLLHTVWAEKYRPKTVDECILPDRIKDIAKGFVKNGSIPHLIFSGSAGTGKTTLGKALCHELGYDVLFINGSLDANMSTLRDDVTQFASALSLEGNRKCVFIDEGDYISTPVMAAMRSLMETMSANCTFIITCNFPNRILDAIKSRTSIIDFSITKEEYSKLTFEALKRFIEILNLENVEHDPKVVAKILSRNYPDLRKTFNDLQRYASSGKIDVGSLGNTSDGDFVELVNILKDRNFADLRKWVASSPTVDLASLCRYLDKNIEVYSEKKNCPQIIITMCDYQYKSQFVADRELLIAAMLTEVMLAS